MGMSYYYGTHYSETLTEGQNSFCGPWTQKKSMLVFGKNCAFTDLDIKPDVP